MLALDDDDTQRIQFIDVTLQEVLILAKVPARYFCPAGVTATMKRDR
jgi:hypothetical protein